MSDVSRPPAPLGVSPWSLEPPARRVADGILALVTSNATPAHETDKWFGDDLVKKVLGGANKVVDATTDIGNAVKGVGTTIGKVTGTASDISGVVGSVVGSVTGSNSTNKAFDKIQDVFGKVSDVSGTVSEVAGKVIDATAGIQNIIDLLLSFTTPVGSGGHSLPYVNRVLCLCLGLILLVVAGLYALERSFSAISPAKGRPRLWLLGMLITSYVILIPGLMQVLFSFTLAVELLGLHVTVTRSSQDPSQPGSITESMVSVIHTLHKTGSDTGAVLVVLYAMVIPGLKLVLLFIGELWRFSSDAGRIATARWCIRVVQLVSKWACPDMFAYILLLYLLRSLDQRSSLIAAPAQLDDGFSCFSIFCICSTFSSLAIPLPARPASGEQAAEAQSVEEAIVVPKEPSSGRALLWLVGLMHMVFSALYCLGLLLPCMSLKLDTSLLVEPKGPLPAVVLPFLKLLDLESQVNSEVSMWQCLVALMKWLYYGEATCILALVMLGVFALLLPVANMIVLVFAAQGITSQAERDPEDKPSAWTVGAMKMAHVIKHLSMLDVAVMGVFIICLAGKSYQSQGVLFGLRPGLLFLFLAEVIHYVTYYMVQHAAKAAEPSILGDSS